MVKKMKTRLKTEKVMTRKKLEAQIQGKSQMFFRNLQQILEKSCDINRDSNDADRVHTRNTKESSLRRDYTFSHGNILNKDIPINYMCYRCEHFLEIPRNLSQPFSDRESIFKEQCKNELRFIQAIVWLKSSIACASQIPVKQLQQIFNKQWSTHGEDNHHEDEHTDVEQLRFSVDKDLSMYKRMSMKDTIATSTPLNISDVSCVTSQRTICSSYARFEDLQGIPLDSVLVNDLNESSSNESLILESSNSHYTIAREKKGYCTIPETDVESVLNENLDIFDDIPEHQSSFEHEEGMRYSAQSALKNGTKQINKKIIEKKHIFQKGHADVPCERKYILSVRNQSIDSMFEYNGDGFTSMRNQHDFANKARELNDSPKSFIITPRNLSQMSNVRNEYFEFLLNDNSPWRANNTAIENSNKDSAYSTSRIDIFNCDTAVETGSIIGNKRVPNSEHYELQLYKKKTITHKKGKIPCLINRMLTSDDSFKSFTMSEKDISQVSNISNDKNFKFQIVSSDDEQMNNISSENPAENHAAVAAKSIISNKRTKNIEYSYELYPRNENRVTRQKMVSPSIIQRAVIPHTNIEHCYNLRACNNRRISHEKETSSVIIPGPQERKSERTGNLSKEENKNEDEMIFADWLNFTVESLHVERVILTSIKVIVSTFCDKRMAEEYMIRLYLWRNMRNYWKGSLEEEAVNAVLNISDIFTIEEKPNICIKIIVMAIVNTLNEMTMRGQLYKIYCTQTSVWIDRVQILLEFCNSLSICGKVTDYLIRKLKSLQSLLTNVKKIQKYDCVAIKQLHLVFYALNITLQKYRTIIPNDHRSRSTEKVIPHVADLWKVHYINKELEQTGLDLDAAEKQWLNTLENSAKAFINFGFATFAKKSFSLVHVLISQSSARVT